MARAPRGEVLEPFPPRAPHSPRPGGQDERSRGRHRLADDLPPVATESRRHGQAALRRADPGRFGRQPEGYQQVSIGERLRTLDGEPVDTSGWLAPLELAGETDGAPVKVVNRLTPGELDEIVNAGAERPLGCLPMRLEDYAELLRWLAGNPSKANAEAGPADSSAEAAVGSVAILRRLSLDPAAFADLVGNFGKRFSTAVGCPESLEREALRRGRRRLRAPGGPALARRHPKPPTAAVAGCSKARFCRDDELRIAGRPPHAWLRPRSFSGNHWLGKRPPRRSHPQPPPSRCSALLIHSPRTEDAPRKKH